MASTPTEELIGVFDSESYRKPDTNWIVAHLDDGTKITGVCEPGSLVSGLSYRFIGFWKETDWGDEFKFSAFIQDEPHSRAGVVEYLARYTPGIGEGRANRLCDLYGEQNAIATLKTDPARVAADIKGLTLEAAELASQSLIEQEQFQETKVDLLDLFVKRGFPHKLVDECVKRWGIKAAERIRRDPFVMLVCKLPGCGFLRCDRLYLDLGLPPDRLKRQVMAAWHMIRGDSTGSTWFAWDAVVEGIGQRITGNVRAERAIQVALRAKWLMQFEGEADDGGVWVGDYVRCRDEGIVADALGRLMGAAV